MIANYHTHTPRCRHAGGTEEEYVRCALNAGLQILGFADHTPYPFPEGYYSTFRMYPEELPDYVASVEDVRKRYAGQIQILLGVEAEYYPKYFRDMVAMLRDHGVEYMLLGQHMVGNEVGEPYLGIPSDAAGLERYSNQVIEALYTGLFTYLAHPDLVHFLGDPELYRANMRRICRAAKGCGIPLEINLLGLRNKRHYPNPILWEAAAEEGCSVILGHDAHQPEQLLDRESEQQAREMAGKLGLEILDRVELVRL